MADRLCALQSGLDAKVTQKVLAMAREQQDELAAQDLEDVDESE